MVEGCAAIEPLLSAWLDGELDSHEVDIVRAHLAGCRPCGEVADDLAEVASALGNLPVRCAPAELGAVAGATSPSMLRRVRALAVATGLLVGVAFALGAGEADQRPVPAPLDAFVADQFGDTGRDQTTTQVILETRP